MQPVPFNLGAGTSWIENQFARRGRHCAVSDETGRPTRTRYADARCVSDVTRVRQILVNLRGNAVKFTNQGDVAVHVVSATQSAAGRFEIRFTVEDTGIGIPADRIDRLFQPFSQTDASTTRKYGGTGLGLAICRRLTELLGGRIWVESEPDKGTRFLFTIQASAGTLAAVSGPLSRDARLADVPQPRLAGSRVLIRG
ncbi:MAG: hypothetical protein GEU82_13185 [Luteitalea sp.]|nr:hypothetical protein [Luteitalea sp.]